MIRVLKWVLGSLLLLGATQVSAKCIQAGNFGRHYGVELGR